MQNFKIKTILLCILFSLLIYLSGCDKKTSSKITPKIKFKVGSNCTVQFRRNYLGGTSSNIIPITTDGINGAQISLSGKLTYADNEWIVVNQSNIKKEYWIPREVILHLRFSK